MEQVSTAAIIEGAMLYMVLQLKEVTRGDLVILLAAGSMLVLLCCLLSLKDRVDVLGHLERLSEFERGISTFKPRKWYFLKGWMMMSMIIVMLNGFNAYLLYRFVRVP